MDFTTKLYKVNSDRIPDTFDGFRIVFLTDLHNLKHGKNNKKLYKKIVELCPDLVLIGGDMVIGMPKFHKIKRLAHFYSMLVKHFPVFYAYGNHETRLALYEDIYGTPFLSYINMVKRRGIRVLNNKSAYIAKYKGQLRIFDDGSKIKAENIDKIRISGLNMDLDYYEKFWKRKTLPEDYIERKLGDAGEDYEILLAHHPRYFEYYEKWGADLVLLGHIHGGVMRLPFVGGVASPDFTLFPKYSAGKLIKKRTVMIVSKGLGEHTIPVRIFDPRELTVVDLYRR